ncbi:MAG: hypothetical protein WCH61_08405 [bacterium]
MIIRRGAGAAGKLVAADSSAPSDLSDKSDKPDRLLLSGYFT